MGNYEDATFAERERRFVEEECLVLKKAFAVGLALTLAMSGCAAPDGPQGADGPQGSTGQAGTNGTNGTNGKDGVNGEAGEQGPKGDPGSSIGFPAGVVVPFAGLAANIPAGWAACDGSAVSRTSSTYSTLFGVIGTLHGNGDGVNTFNLPDYRGRFLRGVDNGVGNDPDTASRTAAHAGGSTGDAVGSVQGTATKRPTTAFTTDTQGSHTHTPTGSFGGNVGVWDFGGPAESGNLGGGGQNFINLTLSSAGSHSHTITAGGDNESRPPNAYVNYIIKL